MGKNRLPVILGITVLGISLLCAGCGKKGDNSPADVVEKASEEVKEETSEDVNGTAPEKANEEASDEVDEASSDIVNEIMGVNSDSTDELTGVWQLSADTPAGDPYIFGLEIDEDNNVSYCGYSLTGDNWFQNFCYDGTVTRDEDNSDILFELSEIDYNGTETDRITCGYNAQVCEGRPDSLILEHLSGRYIGPEDVGECVTFVKADKAIYSGESL